MITLTFEEFRRGDYDDKGESHTLYVLKRGTEVLYVGISKRGAWERWFGGWGSHIMRNGWGEDYDGSHVGRVVIENSPESNGWIVELWTLEDCAELFLGPNPDMVQMPLGRAEDLMIDRLRPNLNVMKVTYKQPFDDSRAEDLQKAHREIFK